MMYSSESVMMGSPGTGTPLSPASPTAHDRSSFLPAYLMGEPVQSPSVASPRLWSSSTVAGGSPPKSVGKGSTILSPPLNQSHLTPRTEGRQRDLLGGRRKDKLGAPPTAGLLNSTNSSAVFSPEAQEVKFYATRTPAFREEYNRPQSEYGTPAARVPTGASFTGTPSGPPAVDSSACYTSPTSQVYGGARKTPPSPAQVDPFYTQGESIRPEDELDDTWITVFGFPSAATSFVLQQFSQYGNIVKHVVATDGNWMHLRYQSRLQAKKALSKNGKVFGSSIMVGVAPCIDKSVMACDADQENLHKSSLFQAVGEQDSMRHTPIRPLTAAYKAASSDHQVLQGGNTPKKDNGVISKALGYMFGW